MVGCVSFERCSWGHSQGRMVMITIFAMSSQGGEVASGLLGEGLRPSAWAQFEVAAANRTVLRSGNGTARGLRLRHLIEASQG